MNQVHKENLSQVENALPNRQGLEVEIFGMEGIPQEILDQHRNRIIQNFYQAQEDRRIATGNPLPGQAKPARKKLKVESADELKKRLEEFRAQKKTAGANGTTVDAAVPTSGSPATTVILQTPTGDLLILIILRTLSSCLPSNSSRMDNLVSQHNRPTAIQPTRYQRDRLATWLARLVYLSVPRTMPAFGRALAHRLPRLMILTS